jgi:hypothetical protein
MRAILWIQCALWVANAIVWSAYAGVPFMAVVSAVSAISAGLMAIRGDTYY